MNGSVRLYVLGALLAFGCDEEPQLDCTELDGTPGMMFCDDFNDGDAAAWVPEGGAFSVEGGRYIGRGPETVGGPCGASMMTASLREGSSARDVAVHVAMRSLTRVDKVIVLRATDASNRIELNFRADPLNDLVVQELVGCDFIHLTDEGEVVLPHAMEETLHIDVELRGDRLVVVRDGELVLDRSFEFANDGPGLVGVAVIDRAVTSFDSFWVETL